MSCTNVWQCIIMPSYRNTMHQYLYAEHSFWHLKILKNVPWSLSCHHCHKRREPGMQPSHNVQEAERRRPVWFACSAYKMEQIRLKRLFYVPLQQTEKSGQAHWRIAKSAYKGSSMPVQLNSTHLILATRVPGHYNIKTSLECFNRETIVIYFMQTEF